jgi:hypothetical protein
MVSNGTGTQWKSYVLSTHHAFLILSGEKMTNDKDLSAFFFLAKFSNLAIKKIGF